VPSEVRNSYDRGGGVLLGYIPKVCFLPPLGAALEIRNTNRVKSEAPAEEKERAAYRNFTRTAYHHVWWELLKSLEVADQYGMAVKCGDSVTRVVFPAVYIMSMDYEEQ
jgi:hypothetical protein